MWIKICANTNLEDARLAADLGAHAIGFVFAPSSRQVTPALAAVIAADLPPHIERIGVFGRQDADEIERMIHEGRLTGAQLHGGLDLNVVRRLRRAFPQGISLTQTLHWDVTPGASSPVAALRTQLREIRREPGIDRVLVDSKVGSAQGGTGVPFDWAAAADLFREELGQRKLIIAGGLNAENVAEAISRLEPWGVDVASGVESHPGKKDPKKLEAFLMKASG